MSGMSGSGSVFADAQVVGAPTVIEGEGSVQATAGVQTGPGVSDQKFLTTFPEFNDASRYPTLQRKMWFDIAVANTDPCRWGEYYPMGIYLFVAHHLALFGNQRGRSPNSMPGRIPFTMGSKSVGAVSVSYDTSLLSSMKGLGIWGLTLYGMEYYRLLQLLGMGGVQIGYGYLPPAPSGHGFQGPNVGYPNSWPAAW